MIHSLIHLSCLSFLRVAAGKRAYEAVIVKLHKQPNLSTELDADIQSAMEVLADPALYAEYVAQLGNVTVMPLRLKLNSRIITSVCLDRLWMLSASTIATVAKRVTQPSTATSCRSVPSWTRSTNGAWLFVLKFPRLCPPLLADWSPVLLARSASMCLATSSTCFLTSRCDSFGSGFDQSVPLTSWMVCCSNMCLSHSACPCLLWAETTRRLTSRPLWTGCLPSNLRADSLRHTEHT